MPYPEGVPEELVDEYLRVRTRNLSVIQGLVKLAELGFVDTLVLGQDDSNKTGLHRFEQESIAAEISRANVSDKATLLSGIDELSMCMVSGVWAKRSALSPNYAPSSIWPKR